jgi:hypothetical protein
MAEREQEWLLLQVSLVADAAFRLQLLCGGYVWDAGTPKSPVKGFCDCLGNFGCGGRI